MDMIATTNTRPLYANYPFIIAVVALAASLAMAFGIFRLQTFVANAGDPYQYGEYARALVDHGFTKLTRRGASLYVEAIAVVYRLGGSNFTVVLLQCLLHLGTCLLAFSLGKRLYNARTGLLAGLICALHPMLLRYVADLHMETLVTFLCVLMVWLSVRFHEHPTVVNGILLGAVGMIGTLTKGVILPLVAVFGIISLVFAIKRRSVKEVVAVGAIFVTMALLLAPWTYRNYQVTGGKFVLLTPGFSDSFLRGYIFTRMEFATLQKPPFTDAENESNAWFEQIARDAGTTWEADEVVDEENNKRVVKHMIATQPLDTARKISVGLFTFWYEMTSLPNSLVPAALAIIGWLLAFIGWRRSHSEGRPAWLLWVPIVVMNVFVATLIPLGRYSVPILPLLTIMAAFGVDTLLSRRGTVTSRPRSSEALA
ncbi:ArnT family glycosyltransferase [Hyphomicrobium facile]|uniref:Dolichyl-phosphate-mannose-protein mannosyltransferase n=1 Tax=Hyphomicrobium facile TaxID=51670 RepID=A0A1I7NFV9_9HYPH|nr:glycosyltransferase family 39 protein [Hyphomicrobium facile]SFV33436.1 Dolichyl-phosphate-mannose-protein mannosyltransferase [Hyphomicrobium facile]